MAGKGHLTSMPQGLYLIGDYTLVLRRPRRCLRGGDPGLKGDLRTAPRVYNYLVDKRRFHIVNFCAPEQNRLLQESGLGSVPCDNPGCDGLQNGQWDTSPLQWSFETGGPHINIDENGMPAPLYCMRSKCNTCGHSFHHIGPVTLARLRDVPALREDLPFDPEWRFGMISLHRVHTNAFETDIITRQGMETLLKKVERNGAAHIHSVVEAYLADGQLWISQLSELVGDPAWGKLSLRMQQHYSQLRGEWLLYDTMEDKISPLGKGGGRAEANRFMLPELQSGGFLASIMEVFERRRELRERQMCAVGCDMVCSLDFCNHSGVMLGGKWQMLLTNEENSLISSKVTSTTKLEGVIEHLQMVKKRPNFNARVAIIDNVPPSIDLSVLSKLEKSIMQSLGVEWVGQDRFHVAHSFSPKFNNTHELFFPLIILEWRHATVERDRDCERLVDEKLMAGEISKSCTFRGQKIEIQGVEWRVDKGDWQSVEQESVSEWKASGLYHELFSTSPNVIVPEHVLRPEALFRSVDRYMDRTLNLIFLPPDDDGYRAPARTGNKQLCQCDFQAVRKIFENAKARIMKCSPPEHLRQEAWQKTGKQDHNNVDIWKPRFHSCGTENWNSQQSSFVVGANTTKEHATALFYEGNAKLITKKEVGAGRQEDLATSNPTVPLRCNAWAGHSNDSPCHRHMLLRCAPFHVSLPPAPAEDEVCLQPCGRFDVSSRRKTPPQLPLEFAPRTKFRLSQYQRLLQGMEAATTAGPAAGPSTASPLAAGPSTASPAAGVPCTASPLTAGPASSFVSGPSTGGSTVGATPNHNNHPLPSYLPPNQTLPCKEAKRKYSQLRQRVPGRDSKKNPWFKGGCLCIKQAGRSWHKPLCPIERWLTEANFSGPAVHEEAGPPGKRMEFNGAKWVPLAP